MGVEDEIEKLEASNKKLKVDLNLTGEQFEDLRKDPKFEGLVDDLEKLGFAYLTTWINSNSDIIEILNKEK